MLLTYHQHQPCPAPPPTPLPLPIPILTTGLQELVGPPTTPLLAPVTDQGRVDLVDVGAHTTSTCC